MAKKKHVQYIVKATFTLAFWFTQIHKKKKKTKKVRRDVVTHTAKRLIIAGSLILAVTTSVIYRQRKSKE